jgi:hypothetical protein
MTKEQRRTLKQQAERVQETKRTAERELSMLKAMLLMHDARFADPASGMAFDIETMEITGGSHADQ